MHFAFQRNVTVLGLRGSAYYAFFLTCVFCIKKHTTFYRIADFPKKVLTSLAFCMLALFISPLSVAKKQCYLQ